MIPTKHDHVGHMEWTKFRARCTGCGQVWVLHRDKRTGWMQWQAV